MKDKRKEQRSLRVHGSYDVCVCSFFVYSAYAQENVTGLLSRANFRSLTCPNAGVAHPNRFCASALTCIDQHLLKEIGLTQGLRHICLHYIDALPQILLLTLVLAVRYSQEHG